jgi:DNA-directed RNA polymerase specialized sigma subunit
LKEIKKYDEKSKMWVILRFSENENIKEVKKILSEVYSIKK